MPGIELGGAELPSREWSHPPELIATAKLGLHGTVARATSILPRQLVAEPPALRAQLPVSPVTELRNPNRPLLDLLVAFQSRDNRLFPEMGSSQSTVAEQQIQQTLVDRLRALEVNKVADVSEKEGYVYVGSSSSEACRCYQHGP